MLPGPHDRRARAIPARDLARPLGRHPAAPRGRVRRVARVRWAAPGPAALLHRAGRRPRDARARHRGLAGRAARQRADLRLARRPHRAGAADGHRARGDRRLRRAAAGPDRAARLRPAARRGRAQCRDLRPGGPRLPDRRDAAGQAAARRSGCTARPRWAACCSARRSARSAPTDFGGIGFVFVFSAVAAVVAALADRACGSARRRSGRIRRPRPTRPSSRPTRRRSSRRAASDVDADRDRAPDPTLPTQPLEPGPHRGHRHQRRRLLRGRHLRGHLEPLPRRASGRTSALIGLTFAMFGLPVLLFSPFAGRDRRPARLVRVHRHRLRSCRRSAGSRTRCIRDPVLAVPLILIEATGFAFLNPALYAVVAANSPAGRSSTAQGLFGAAGTLGFIVASLAGRRARGVVDHTARSTCFVGRACWARWWLGLLIGGSRVCGAGTV